MTDETIFAAALELSDPAARAAYLAGACSADPDQLRRVERLLAANERAGEFLERPAVGPPTSSGDHTLTYGDGDDDAAAALGLLSPSERPDSLGRLGHYEILEVLGRGGFGIVFRAFDELLQRVVALKVMAPSMAVTSPARKRFLREARSAAKVRHPNVVGIHAVDEVPLPHLVMEFIPGETLQQRLDRTGPLEVPEILSIGRQIAEGLAAAHQTGLIHRDIKPSNILIDGPDGHVRITDFGLARAADDASLTRSGAVAGTPMYMAPEQAKGETLDHRADLFSLGSVLYVMCTGRPPFRAESTLAVLKRVAEDTPRPMREVIPELPEWLCRIVGKLHAKDRTERFQSAREVAEVLADCERQVKAHGAMRDFSRIPGGGPRRLRRLSRWATATALFLVIGASVAWWRGWVDEVFAPRPVAVLDRSYRPDPPPHAVAPFDAAKAREHQEAWARHLGLPVEADGPLGMRLAMIPPGVFRIGSTDEEVNLILAEIDHLDGDDAWKTYVPTESPPQRVRLERPLQMSTHEVTLAQFRRFLEAVGYVTEAEDANKKQPPPRNDNKWFFDPKRHWKDPGPWEPQDGHPILCVTWNDAVAFCEWVSETTGRSCRLPTEAEWEFACRAGSDGRYSFGDDPFRQSEYAVFGRQAPNVVGTKRPNAFGLFDMEGNAWEWCEGGFGEGYGTEPLIDPRGNPETGLKVIRGGAYISPGFASRCASRWLYSPDYRDPGIGFRVVFDDLHRAAPPPAVAPFEAAEAEHHRKAWAKHLGVPLEQNNSVGMRLCLIPPGEFDMGASPAEMGRYLDHGRKNKLPVWYAEALAAMLPRHRVTILAPFYAGATEVTIGQFRRFAEATGYKTEAERDGKGGAHWVGGDLVQKPEFVWRTPAPEPYDDDHPAVHVTYADAKAFCTWLSESEGREYRLPTEAEWEYVCRAGTESNFHTGDAFPEGSGNCDFRKGRATRAGSYPANPFGLHDLHGNVWEWCQDYAGSTYYATSPEDDPTGPEEGQDRVIRGGGWDTDEVRCGSGYRLFCPPTDRDALLGFRVVLVGDLGSHEPSVVPGE